MLRGTVILGSSAVDICGVLKDVDVDADDQLLME